MYEDFEVSLEVEFDFLPNSINFAMLLHHIFLPRGIDATNNIRYPSPRDILREVLRRWPIGGVKTQMSFALIYLI